MQFAGLVIWTLPETTQRGLCEYSCHTALHFWGHFCLGLNTNSGSHRRILYGHEVHTTKASSTWVSSRIHPYFVALCTSLLKKYFTFRINRVNVPTCSFKQISFPTFAFHSFCQRKFFLRLFLSCFEIPTIFVRQTLLNGLLAIPRDYNKKRGQQNCVPSVLAACCLSLSLGFSHFPWMSVASDLTLCEDEWSQRSRCVSSDCSSHSAISKMLHIILVNKIEHFTITHQITFKFTIWRHYVSHSFIAYYLGSESASSLCPPYIPLPWLSHQSRNYWYSQSHFTSSLLMIPSLKTPAHTASCPFGL